MNTLRERAVSGVKWMGSASGANAAIDFLRVAVLAHLLSPRDFGLIGMVLVFTGLVQTFSDMGLNNAIINRQDTTKEELSSLYWLNISVNVALFALLMLSVPLVVWFYGEPVLKNILMLVSVNFLISPVGQQFQVILQKELKFRDIATVEVSASVINFVVSVVLASAGFGVYSLVLGGLAAVAFTAAGFVFKGVRIWRPTLRFRPGDLKKYLSFGLCQMGERGASFFSYSVDSMLIGRFLGAQALGIYGIAYQLILKPVLRINPFMTRVAFPVFSMKQNDNAALKRGFLELTKGISILSFPILGGLAIVSPEFVGVVYGAKWLLAIPIIQILSVVGILWTLQNSIAYTLLSKGRAGITFVWTLCMAVTNTLVFYFVVNSGIFYIAWSWVALLGFFYAVELAILMKVIGMRVPEYLRTLSRPLLITAAMIVIVWATRFLVGVDRLNAKLGLGLLVVLGALFYAIAMLIFDGKYVRELFAMVLGKKGESANQSTSL